MKELPGAKQIFCSHPKCSVEALEFKYLDYFKNYVDSIYDARLRV